MAKLFSKLYDPMMGPLERIKIREIRQRILQKAQGQVLEVGSGTGLNFPYYTHADRVIAIEPDRFSRERALKKAVAASLPIKVLPGDAQYLTFSENTFDTVIGTLVFCTIPNPDQALKEIRRVCKPNGTILLVEHVRVEHPLLGRLQDWLTPAWKRMCGGCHLNRDTLSLVQKSGFTITRFESHYKGLFHVIEAANLKKAKVR